MKKFTLAYMKDWTDGRPVRMIFSKAKCLACIDNQISLPMVFRYNEIYYFLRVDGPITKGA